MSPQMGVVTDADLAAAVAAHNALTIAHGTVDDVADQTDIATHAADLDAHTRNYLEIVRTGMYHITYPTGGAANPVLVADRLYAVPFYIARALTIDRLAIQVTAGGGAGTRARLGIYNVGVNLYPGTLLIDGGTVNANVVAVAELAVPQALTKGIYFAALLTDGTPTVRAREMKLSVLGVDPADIRTNYTHWLVIQAYGALPDPFTAGGALQVGDPLLILPRIASLD